MSLKNVIFYLGTDLIRKLGSIEDLVGDTGIYTQKIREWVSLSGNAFSWNMDADYSGFKRIYAANVATGANAARVAFNNVKTIKYDGTTLTTMSGVTSTGANQTFIDSGRDIYFTVADVDSGWLESWVPGTAWVGMTRQNLAKAYANGWKMTTADLDVANCVWTGIVSGATQSGAAGYSHVIANIDNGYTPYKAIYELSTYKTTQLSMLSSFSSVLKTASYGKDNLAI